MKGGESMRSDVSSKSRRSGAADEEEDVGGTREVGESGGEGIDVG